MSRVRSSAMCCAMRWACLLYTSPQYFAPGVAGDHGEPIAQYISVGSYLLPNNLSANAHGNGYADPNIYIADAIESVEVDGGAFNVREGNHALNLATTYSLRSHLNPFLTFTGDQRDITAVSYTHLDVYKRQISCGGIPWPDRLE